MPERNNFQHQVYSTDRPSAEFHFILPEYVSPETAEFSRRMSTVGKKLANAGVVRVFLVHGSFTGTDALGIIREFTGIAPVLAALLSKQQKRITDSIAGETGNFTKGFESLLASSINADTTKRIHVRCYDWSGENNHLGRAEAAVKLIAELGEIDRDRRTLLIGHSHAGNVFAIVSNLLGATEESRDRFFDAVDAFYAGDENSAEAWPDFRHLVKDRTASRQLDLVTLGTPVRYGWETAGFGRLLHFVNHRPVTAIPSYLAKFPTSLNELRQAESGDYVQQLGIAGTNLLPYLMRSRNLRVERRLSKLLQTGINRRDSLDRLRKGVRVHEDGITLLCDYPDDAKHLRRLALGHGVYTRPEFMVFHFEEIVRRIYQ